MTLPESCMLAINVMLTFDPPDKPPRVRKAG
ncbi:hypothetical protein HMPREF9695_00302 [Afipia broomeae ATCC 49717]|uniref:Uncharacterized protein n=1 Tax=Afipia broomeae ATCC 49717 TaxID=883078 RepID=K8PNX9_9BRAD|nr:hypothetical protein HMPREF9695_00302 [Afipia broomeae ATCC 49717]